jgi:hypothetical protein
MASSPLTANSPESILLATAQKLGLSVSGPLEGVFQDNVVAAFSNGRDVVLKSPRGSDNIYGEARAMALLAAHGLAPRSELYEGVLVIDRVRPGTMMSATWPFAPDGTIEAHLKIAGGLIAEMSRIDADGLDYYVEDLLRHDVLRSLGTKGEITAEVLDPAVITGVLGALTELSPVDGPPTLCHGDFYANNILWDGGGWVVIDPRAVVGDPCADVGRMAACVSIDEGWEIEEAVEVLCGAAGLDQRRSVVWARAWLLQTLGHHWRFVAKSGPGIDRYIELLTRA